ncbi:MAG: hypothetical protein WD512_08500 [Candidatus Paceibacterota bacterium]
MPKSICFHLPVEQWQVILTSAQARASIAEKIIEKERCKIICSIIRSHSESINSLLRDKTKYEECPRHLITFPPDLQQIMESLIPK